ncbi:kazrin-like isoform X3 [Artemia franciscana]|uniref:kazrin-like isoform X3 n=1 Tax=Artemia franciscana TaxID=6661 RepID=UPI0032DA41D6
MTEEERHLIGKEIDKEIKLDSDRVKNASEPSRKLTVITLNNCGNCVVHPDSVGKDMTNSDTPFKELEHIKKEDNSIYEEMSRMRRDFNSLMKETDDAKKQSQPQVQHSKVSEDSLHIIKGLETDLQNARDALAVLKADRKRLKAEKFELLNQMKQLYGTIEEKEKELRTFIRSFEMMRRRLNLLEKRQDSEDHYATVSDCAITLGVVARKEDIHIYSTGAEKQKLSDKTVIIEPRDDGNQHSASAAQSSDAGESGQPSHLPSSESCRSSSSGLCIHSGNDDNSTGNRLMSDPEEKSEKQSFHRLDDRSFNKESQKQRNSSHIQRPRSLHPPGKGGIGPWGSISKVFTRRNPRKSFELYSEEDGRSSRSPQQSICTTPHRDESLKERLMDEILNQPIENWKSATVLTWMESVLGLGQYIHKCAENVKSGKILLDLSDSEYEAGLGISHPMHRKKLRLAVEEKRHLPVGTKSLLDDFDTAWVVEDWLQDIGLPQYSETFKASLIDGRLLEALTKKELEKYLSVAKKFHQTSVIHGVTFLKLLKFDKKALKERRDVSSSADCDPIVWTNRRLIEWMRSIDLGEYADSLRESGLHGALIVLESSFTADTFATILGILPSKSMVRRHLQKEFEALIQVARVRYQQRTKELKAERRRNEKLSGGGSLGRAFSKSFSGGLSHAETFKQQNDSHLSSFQKLTLRFTTLRKSQSSLNKGNQRKNDHRLNTTTPYISSPMSPVSPVSFVPTYGFLQPRPTSLVDERRSSSEKHRRVRSSGEAEPQTITKI